MKGSTIALSPDVKIKFGGWYDGDNYKPGRAWYFTCPCGHVGLGQLLLRSAVKKAEKHARNCAKARAVTNER